MGGWVSARGFWTEGSPGSLVGLEEELGEVPGNSGGYILPMDFRCCVAENGTW